MTKQLKTQSSNTGMADVLIKRYMTGPALRNLIRQALEEDLGPGDLTNCIFAPAEKGKARLLARADGILSGTAVVNEIFRQMSKTCKVTWKKKDGQPFRTNDILAEITGPLRALLQGERVALNFLQRLSGIATITRAFTLALPKRKDAPGIYDTRKTTPLLRALEKQAVIHGGGRSHRFALYDMAMLKNNHIDAAGGVSEAIDKLMRSGFNKLRPRPGICIEARTLDEAVEATWAGADIIMLDNMTPAQIRRAAAAVTRESSHLGKSAPQLEISGGITLRNIARYADLPVQRISIGALTHSAPSIDISMRYAR